MLDWLLGPRAPGRTPEEAFGDLCRALRERGIAIYRVGLFVRTLHPNVAGRAYFWREDRDQVEVDSADHSWFATEDHLKSPIHAVWTMNAETRRRLADPACPMDYPVLADLRAEGATDYVAVPLRFLSGEIHVASFASRRPGG